MATAKVPAIVVQKANDQGVVGRTLSNRRPARGWLGRTLGPMAQGSLRGSIFTLMSAAVGPGSLLLPYMFRLVGVPLGLLCLFFGAYCSAQSMRFIITIAHLTGCDSYSGGVKVVLGSRTCSVVSHVTNFVLLLSIGSHLKFLNGILPRLLPPVVFEHVPLSLVAVAVAFVPCSVRDISVLRHVAWVAPVSLMYVIALIISRGLLTPPSPGSANRLDMGLLRFGEVGIAALPRAWSMVLNALMCHHMAVPVYRQLHRAQAKRVNKVVLRSITFCSCLYGLVGISGFLTHVGATPENILLVYPPEDQAALVAQVLVGCTLLVAIPLGLHAVRVQILSALPSNLADTLRGPGHLPLTATLLLLPLGVCKAFRSVSAIIGIACGFGMAVYMFLVPVAAMYVLRWKNTDLPKCGLEVQEMLLSSPLSSPLLGPKQRGMVTLRGPGAPRLNSTPSASAGTPQEKGPPNCLRLPQEPPPLLLLPQASASHEVIASPCASDADREPGEADTSWLRSGEFVLTLIALVIGAVLGFLDAASTVATMLRPNSAGLL